MAATDPFLSTYRTDRSPFRSAAAITPSDSTDLTVIPRAVYGPDEPVWRWSDPHRSMLRVHLKLVDDGS